METSLFSSPHSGQGSWAEKTGSWGPALSSWQLEPSVHAIPQHHGRKSERASVRTKGIPIICEVTRTHRLGKRETCYLTPACWNTKIANHQRRTNIFLEESGQWHIWESPLKSNIEALLPRSFCLMSEVKPTFSPKNGKDEKKSSEGSEKGEGLKSHSKPDRAFNWQRTRN